LLPGISRNINDTLSATVQWLLAGLLSATLWVALTGGGRLDLGRLTLSLRGWDRPLGLFFILLVGFALWGWRRHPHYTVSEVAGASGVARIGLLSLVMLVPALWVTYLDAAAGGLDSYGYVSASLLLASGHLQTVQPSVWLGIPDAIKALTPLGYLPSLDGTAIVPEFPLGLPAVMALFLRLFGAIGPFLVAPVLATGCVVLTFVLVRRVTSIEGALLAAILVAVQPVFFGYAIQPMSDVAATFWIVLAVTLLMRERPYSLLAGLAAGLALWTRPPLGLAALALPFLPITKGTNRPAYALGFAPGLVALMGVQWVLYGGPFASGHGTADSLFSFDMLAHNLGAHARWLIVENTPLLPLALVVAWRFGHRRFLWSALALFVLVTAPYLLYRVPFDDWEMQRFLLPGLVFLLMSAADGTQAFFARVLPRATAPLATLALAALLAFASHTFLGNRGVYRLADSESKFPRVGAWFSAKARAGDVVLAALHSGSIRYYSDRTTIRWDQLTLDTLPAVVRAIEARGGVAYLTLDGNTERAQFAQRFGKAPDVNIEYVDRVRTVDIARITVR